MATMLTIMGLIVSISATEYAKQQVDIANLSQMPFFVLEANKVDMPITSSGRRTTDYGEIQTIEYVIKNDGGNIKSTTLTIDEYIVIDGYGWAFPINKYNGGNVVEYDLSNKKFLFNEYEDYLSCKEIARLFYKNQSKSIEVFDSKVKSVLNSSMIGDDHIYFRPLMIANIRYYDYRNNLQYESYIFDDDGTFIPFDLESKYAVHHFISLNPTALHNNLSDDEKIIEIIESRF